MVNIHAIIHELIAAVGGVIFVFIGAAKHRERKWQLNEGYQVNSALLEMLFIVFGITLVLFAAGLIAYQLL